MCLGGIEMGNRRLLLAAAVGMLIGSGAYSATVDLEANAAATNMTAGSIPADSTFDVSSVTGSPSSATTTARATESGTDGSGVTTTSSSADISTGVLSASIDADITLAPSTTAGPGVSGDAFASITETFTLNGTGDFIVSMLVDATWDAPVWRMQSSIQIGAVTAFDSVALSPDRGFGSTGSVDDLLVRATTTGANLTGLTVDVIWDLAMIKSGDSSDGNLSLFNTIWFETTGTLTATPSDPNFLNNALYPSDLRGDDPSVIPLPAGFWFLTSGLLGLGVLRHTKSRVA